MSLTLDGTTGISATGNITGNNVIASGTLTAGTFSPTSLSASGNVTAGNIITAGLISATGNITGAFILGNGSQLTGVDATQIVNGTSNAKVVSSGGNIAVGIGGTANVAVFASTGVFITGVNSVSGNITGGNLLISGAIEDSAQLDIRTTASNANIVFTPNGTGNVNTAANIMPTANATANIGSAALSFNTVFAKATSAQYADLAEMYLADSPLHPGTVVEFGGSNEITIAVTNHSSKVAGIISTRPSYLMNATLTGEHAYPVALTGRVPCTVIGRISKGDCLVSGDHPGAAQRLDSEKFVPGCIIGKALQDHDSDSIGTIEVAVGRF